jgi:hypothetical protein
MTVEGADQPEPQHGGARERAAGFSATTEQNDAV